MDGQMNGDCFPRRSQLRQRLETLVPSPQKYFWGRLTGPFAIVLFPVIQGSVPGHDEAL